MIKTWQERCEEHPDHEDIVNEGMIRARMQEEIDELRQALAQPEQEPVAWHEPGAFGNVTTHKQWAAENGWMPLYTGS